MKKGLLSGLLMAVLTLGWVGTVPQASAATSTCNGVWVVVDYGSLGGTSTKCATSHANGKVALASAGFNPSMEDGMIVRISGKPYNPDINKEYWSYWTATLKSDGSYSGWGYSNLGATSSHPAKGNAEGWRYQSLSDGKVAPGATPPKGEVAAPKPSPTPTRTTAKPTVSAKPTATATPTATRKPTATASTKSGSPTAGASSAATPSVSTTASETPLATSAPTASPAATPAGDASELGQQVTNSQPASNGGSPVGALVAGSLVVAGAAGIGGWWWLKGRKP